MASYKALGEADVDLTRYTPEQRRAVEASRVIDVRAIGFHFTKPLSNFEFHTFDFVLQAYGLFKRAGVLPYPGSFCDQPSKIIECFNTLSAIQNEEGEKERKKQELLENRRTRK